MIQSPLDPETHALVRAEGRREARAEAEPQSSASKYEVSAILMGALAMSPWVWFALNSILGVAVLTTKAGLSLRESIGAASLPDVPPWFAVPSLLLGAAIAVWIGLRSRFIIPLAELSYSFGALCFASVLLAAPSLVDDPDLLASPDTRLGLWAAFLSAIPAAIDAIRRLRS